jgi:RNA-splicing ligase RtcB
MAELARNGDAQLQAKLAKDLVGRIGADPALVPFDIQKDPHIYVSKGGDILCPGSPGDLEQLLRGKETSLDHIARVLINKFAPGSAEHEACKIVLRAGPPGPPPAGPLDLNLKEKD